MKCFCGRTFVEIRNEKERSWTMGCIIHNNNNGLGGCRICGHIPVSECKHEPKFQVGDKVRSVVGTVKRIAKNPDGTDLVVYTNDRGAERFLNDHELELVERPVKYEPGSKWVREGTFVGTRGFYIYLETTSDGHKLWNVEGSQQEMLSNLYFLDKFRPVSA